MSADAPAQAESPFLTASWRDLVMISWGMDASLLHPLLPRGAELDLWEGSALVSLVAFDFADVRVHGVPIPPYRRFPEVNLRYYVRRRMPNGAWRRGVAFMREMVPHALVAWTARRIYGEPYDAHPMKRVAVPEVPDANAGDETSRSLVYEWKRAGEWERVLALTVGRPRGVRRDSLEQFIVEHQWGYTRRGNRTDEYRVEHPPWAIYETNECLLEADIEGLFGMRIAAALTEAPVSTLVADGSDVRVYPGRTIT